MHTQQNPLTFTKKFIKRSIRSTGSG